MANLFPLTAPNLHPCVCILASTFFGRRKGELQSNLLPKNIFIARVYKSITRLSRDAKAHHRSVVTQFTLAVQGSNPDLGWSQAC